MVQQNKRTCSICGKEIAKNNGQFCKSCSGKYYSAKLKKQAVEYKGGKCEICGYDKSISALDFHHIDPTEKEFEISRMLKGTFNTIKSELDKCMLLCANCHREIHSTDYDHIIYEYEKLIKKHDNGQQIAPKKIITSKQQRIEIIKNSNVDFSKFGWSKQLGLILGICSASIVRWMKKNMSDFYRQNCYKEKTDREIDVDHIIKEYKNGKTMIVIANNENIDISRIRAILKEANITRVKPSAKTINMINIKEDKVIKTFSSIKEASRYCAINGQHKSEKPSLCVIAKRISECANGHRKSAYGHKWRFASDI